MQRGKNHRQHFHTRIVVIAIHCNLPLDVAPAVLGFNYEAHNAPAYEFNDSSMHIFWQSAFDGHLLCDFDFWPFDLERLHRRIIFQHNIGQGVAELLIFSEFYRLVYFGECYPNVEFSELGGLNYIKFRGYIGQSPERPVHILYIFWTRA